MHCENIYKLYGFCRMPTCFGHPYWQSTGHTFWIVVLILQCMLWWWSIWMTETCRHKTKTIKFIYFLTVHFLVLHTWMQFLSMHGLEHMKFSFFYLHLHWKTFLIMFTYVHAEWCWKQSPPPHNHLRKFFSKSTYFFYVRVLSHNRYVEVPCDVLAARLLSFKRII